MHAERMSLKVSTERSSIFVLLHGRRETMYGNLRMAFFQHNTCTLRIFLFVIPLDDGIFSFLNFLVPLNVFLSLSGGDSKVASAIIPVL